MANIKEYIINTINSKKYKNIFYNKTSNRKYVLLKKIKDFF